MAVGWPPGPTNPTMHDRRHVVGITHRRFPRLRPPCSFYRCVVAGSVAYESEDLC